MNNALHLPVFQLVLALFVIQCSNIHAMDQDVGSWAAWLGDEGQSIASKNEINLNLNKAPLKLKWERKIGSGYSGPSIKDGKVFVMDWSLNTATKLPSNPFERGEIPGREGVKCFDLKTGKTLWEYSYKQRYTVSYSAGPRATPIVNDKVVYALGAEGRLTALHSDSGDVIWAKDFTKDYQVKTQIWGHAAHPLVYKNMLICMVGGREKKGVVAFDKKNGKEIWSSLELTDLGYCPPTIIKRKAQNELLIWSGKGIFGLEIGTGKIIWNIPWKLRFALSVATPRQYENKLFFTAFYNGSKMIDLSRDTPTVIWETKKTSEKDTTHLHSIMSTPFLQNGSIYGVCSYGQLRCLDIESGNRLWETLEATTGKNLERWANAFIMKNGSGTRFLLFNETGYLIDANLTRDGYSEIGRMNLIKPNGKDMRRRPIVWSHPAVSDENIVVRNDNSVRCFSLKDYGSLR